MIRRRLFTCYKLHVILWNKSGGATKKKNIYIYIFKIENFFHDSFIKKIMFLAKKGLCFEMSRMIHFTITNLFYE